MGPALSTPKTQKKSRFAPLQHTSSDLSCNANAGWLKLPRLTAFESNLHTSTQLTICTLHCRLSCQVCSAPARRPGAHGPLWPQLNLFARRPSSSAPQCKRPSSSSRRPRQAVPQLTGSEPPWRPSPRASRRIKALVARYPRRSQLCSRLPRPQSRSSRTHSFHPSFKPPRANCPRPATRELQRPSPADQARQRPRAVDSANRRPSSAVQAAQCPRGAEPEVHIPQADRPIQTTTPTSGSAIRRSTRSENPNSTTTATMSERPGAVASAARNAKSKPSSEGSNS